MPSIRRLLQYQLQLLEVLLYCAVYSLAFKNVSLESSSTAALDRFEYETLLARQKKNEEQMVADAVLGYTEVLQNLLKLGKGSGLKFVQKILIGWYEPLSYPQVL